MKPTRGSGNEREHGVEHPDSRTQDRADGDLLAGDAAPGRSLERRLDLDLLVGEILGRLVRQKQGELVHELTKHLRRRGDVTQEPELVLHQRVQHLGDLGGRCRFEVGLWFPRRQSPKDGKAFLPG